MSNLENSIQETKEASIRRILLRFNDNPRKLRVELDEICKVLKIVEYETHITMIIPMYMLHNSEVFRLVHSYITDRLKESTALN